MNTLEEQKVEAIKRGIVPGAVIRGKRVLYAAFSFSDTLNNGQSERRTW